LIDLKLHTILIATGNRGKLREFRSLLSALNSRILSLMDLSIDAEFEESGTTFAENARLKAIACSRLTEFPVLADDSGLEVSALGASASDSDRVDKLLKELATSGNRREARFVCALALAKKGKLLLESRGECLGTIAKEPRGTNGFGYDPIFFFPQLGKTLAELPAAEKNLHSHRAHAVMSLLEKIRQ
jgi:XTP/dITP diphosphohydrolase